MGIILATELFIVHCSILLVWHKQIKETIEMHGVISTPIRNEIYAGDEGYDMQSVKPAVKPSVARKLKFQSKLVPDLAMSLCFDSFKKKYYYGWH